MQLVVSLAEDNSVQPLSLCLLIDILPLFFYSIRNQLVYFTSLFDRIV